MGVLSDRRMPSVKRRVIRDLLLQHSSKVLDLGFIEDVL